jgi:hypothetical protein
MIDEEEKFVVTAKQLETLVKERSVRHGPFLLGRHFNEDNIVEIAKSQFPRLEAKVAIQNELEKTKRLLIIVAAFCLMAGGALVVFAPESKEGVSYVVAALLGILPLGAIGVQEFRIQAIGVRVEGGENTVKKQVPKDT